MLITLIPREGTETSTAFVSTKTSLVDYPYSPRGDGNAVAKPFVLNVDIGRVDYPYSPRGDGNLDRFAWVTTGIRELITPIPREGTSSMLIS